MDKEKKNRYDRGRRLVNEYEFVLDNYQKLTFYLNGEDRDREGIEDLEAQALRMEDYMDILRRRIKTANY